MFGLTWAQIFETKGISFGIEDSETGIIFFGLSFSKHCNKKHALFLGAWTFGYVNPFCMGLKQYSSNFRNRIKATFKDNLNKIKLGFMVFHSPNGFGAGPILRFERNF